MSFKLFVTVIAILVVVAVGGVFYLLKNQNGNSQSESQAEVLSLASQNNINNSNNSEESMPKQKNVQKPEMMLDGNKKYSAKFYTTEGDIEVILNSKETPVTVNNFVYLARNKFYDNTIFHRVIEGFMIQGGDPLGNGTGGPGYRFDDEPFEGEYERGVIAMANAGPNTNGSQFFIMHKDTPLPKNYVIFGQVTNGLEVVDKIATAEVEASRMGEISTPVDPVIVEKIEIVEE